MWTWIPEKRGAFLHLLVLILWYAFSVTFILEVHFRRQGWQFDVVPCQDIFDETFYNVTRQPPDYVWPTREYRGKVFAVDPSVHSSEKHPVSSLSSIEVKKEKPRHTSVRTTLWQGQPFGARCTRVTEILFPTWVPQLHTDLDPIYAQAAQWSTQPPRLD